MSSISCSIFKQNKSTQWRFVLKARLFNLAFSGVVVPLRLTNTLVEEVIGCDLKVEESGEEILIGLSKE